MTKSRSPALSATIFNRKHSWKNFFCGSSTSDHWTDGPPTSSFILPIPHEVNEDDETENETDIENELASPSEYLERQHLLSSSSFSRDDGFEDDKSCGNNNDKSSSSFKASTTNSTSQNSSITQFFIDLWKQPFSASSKNYGLYSDENEFRSSSMYEIGSTNPYGTSPNSKSHEPYQKMVCQLTHSNNNLLHENERLSHRVKQLEMAMREQSELLNSIYYTLFRNGINTVAFPDGEEIHLSQFRGQLLNFGKTNTASPRTPLQKTVNGLTGFTAVLRDRQQSGTEKTSDFSSESSLSSGSVDQDELKAAMLKCITKTKYKNNDFDDFVNWLNDSGAQSARFESDRKSRSLEEHMQESLRVRQPLQRSSRIEHARSESELIEGQRPSIEYASPQSLGAIPENLSQQQRPSTSGSLKSKALRHRAQSVAAGKINGFLGSRRTSSCIRQNTEPRNNSQRKSLANLASMRATSSSSSARQPRRNLI